jgi:ribosomal-protein-alanine N-acetyltransferase
VTGALDLAWGDVRVRPVRRRDRRALEELLRVDRDWLEPWEATLPGTGPGMPDTRRMVRGMLAAARAGQAWSFVIEHRGAVAGQITASQFEWGAVCGCSIGYWITRRLAGRGIVPLATALLVDALVRDWGVHRVEICTLPENASSQRVARKLGFRPEGVRRGYIHIGDRWRDHLVFALLAEEVPQDGLVGHILRARHTEGNPIAPAGGNVD